MSNSAAATAFPPGKYDAWISVAVANTPSNAPHEEREIEEEPRQPQPISLPIDVLLQAYRITSGADATNGGSRCGPWSSTAIGGSVCREADPFWLQGLQTLPSSTEGVLQHYTSLLAGKPPALVTVPPSCEDNSASGTDDLPCTFPCLWRGIRNLGNTCYFNAVLQLLLSVAPVRQAIVGGPLTDDGNKNSESAAVFVTSPDEDALLPSGLRELLAQMCFSRVGTGVDPSSFATFLSLDFNVQQDAQEFFTLLIDWLHSTTGAKLSVKDSIDKSFKGNILYQRECDSCHASTKRAEHFLFLTLPVRPALSECLQEFLKPEVIEGFTCEACKATNASATSHQYLRTLPDVLIFHLNRFEFDRATLQRKKVNTDVRYPPELDMAPYVAQWDGARAGDGSNKALPPMLYELRGVLNHKGQSALSGHYTYDRYVEGAWYTLDDEDSIQFSPELHSDSRVQGSFASSDAYMLVYFKKDVTDLLGATPTPDDFPQYLRQYVANLNRIGVEELRAWEMGKQDVANIVQLWAKTANEFFSDSSSAQPTAEELLARSDEAGAPAWCAVPTDWVRLLGRAFVPLTADDVTDALSKLPEPVTALQSSFRKSLLSRDYFLDALACPHEKLSPCAPFKLIPTAKIRSAMELMRVVCAGKGSDDVPLAQSFTDGDPQTEGSGAADAIEVTSSSTEDEETVFAPAEEFFFQHNNLCPECVVGYGNYIQQEYLGRRRDARTLHELSAVLNGAIPAAAPAPDAPAMADGASDADNSGAASKRNESDADNADLGLVFVSRAIAEMVCAYLSANETFWESVCPDARQSVLSFLSVNSMPTDGNCGSAGIETAPSPNEADNKQNETDATEGHTTHMKDASTPGNDKGCRTADFVPNREALTVTQVTDALTALFLESNARARAVMFCEHRCLRPSVPLVRMTDRLRFAMLKCVVEVLQGRLGRDAVSDSAVAKFLLPFQPVDTASFCHICDNSAEQKQKQQSTSQSVKQRQLWLKKRFPTLYSAGRFIFPQTRADLRLEQSLEPGEDDQLWNTHPNRTFFKSNNPKLAYRNFVAELKEKQQKELQKLQSQLASLETQLQREQENDARFAGLLGTDGRGGRRGGRGGAKGAAGGLETKSQKTLHLEARHETLTGAIAALTQPDGTAAQPLLRKPHGLVPTCWVAQWFSFEMISGAAGGSGGMEPNVKVPPVSFDRLLCIHGLPMVDAQWLNPTDAFWSDGRAKQSHILWAEQTPTSDAGGAAAPLGNPQVLEWFPPLIVVPWEELVHLGLEYGISGFSPVIPSPPAADDATGVHPENGNEQQQQQHMEEQYATQLREYLFPSSPETRTRAIGLEEHNGELQTSPLPCSVCITSVVDHASEAAKLFVDGSLKLELHLRKTKKQFYDASSTLQFVGVSYSTTLAELRQMIIEHVRKEHHFALEAGPLEILRKRKPLKLKSTVITAEQLEARLRAENDGDLPVGNMLDWATLHELGIVNGDTLNVNYADAIAVACTTDDGWEAIPPELLLAQDAPLTEVEAAFGSTALTMKPTPIRVNGSGGPGPVAPTEQSQTAEDAGIACPVCTFLNASGMTVCEMCESPLS